MQTAYFSTVLQNNGLNKQIITRHKHGEMLVPTVAKQKIYSTQVNGEIYIERESTAHTRQQAASNY
jgi:hypothetical protein